MSKIHLPGYDTEPTLPRSSVFEYLFPNPTSRPSYPCPDVSDVAYIDGLTGREITRGEVADQAKRLAAGLRSLGLKRGDVGCVYGMNSLEWVNAAMGCQAAGIVVSPANYGYTPPEVLHQLVDSTAKVIFVQPVLLPTLQKALSLPHAPKFPENRIILLCRPPDKPDGRFKCLEEVWSDGYEPLRWGRGDETATAFLCYSSGTTGRAKGVETSHHNMTSQIQALNIAYTQLRKGQDVCLGILPFGHIYGLTVVLHQPLTVGVPVVVLPRFEEISVLTAIQRFKITWALVVPPVLIVLLHSKNVSKFDLSSIRGMQSGAAPLGKDLTEAFERRFPSMKITQGYGLTETSPVTHVMTESEGQSHRGQIGRLMPTFQARLVDAETGKDVGPGEAGEIWFRGPSVMKGYWRNAEATSNAFAHGGWFKTGDVAVVDEHGYYSIVDRVKELIKYKGFQVPPAELEALLLTHPKIADAAVIGIHSHEQATELPRAYVVPLSPVSEDKHPEFADEVMRWVAEKVSNHKRLRGGVCLIKAVPKSPSGKILRKDLRAMAKKEQEDAVKSTRQARL